MRRKRSGTNWGESTGRGGRQLSWMILAFLAGVGVFYFASRVPADESLVSKAETRPELEFFIEPQTFSEIQNAKHLVTGLTKQLVDEIEARLVEDAKITVLTGAMGAASEQRHLLEGIKTLEKEVKEFALTDENYYISRDLLGFLKKAGFWNRWVETYLKIIYEHPTSRLVGDFATEAIAAGKASGREKEIVEAFRHLTSIPREFDGKVQIKAVLISHNAQTQLARSATQSTPGGTSTFKPDQNSGAP